MRVSVSANGTCGGNLGHGRRHDGQPPSRARVSQTSRLADDCRTSPDGGAESGVLASARPRHCRIWLFLDRRTRSAPVRRVSSLRCSPRRPNVAPLDRSRQVSPCHAGKSGRAIGDPSKSVFTPLSATRAQRCGRGAPLERHPSVRVDAANKPGDLLDRHPGVLEHRSNECRSSWSQRHDRAELPSSAEARASDGATVMDLLFGRKLEGARNDD